MMRGGGEEQGAEEMRGGCEGGEVEGKERFGMESRKRC